jgi:hypothetical protein
VFIVWLLLTACQKQPKIIEAPVEGGVNLNVITKSPHIFTDEYLTQEVKGMGILNNRLLIYQIRQSPIDVINIAIENSEGNQELNPINSFTETAIKGTSKIMVGVSSGKESTFEQLGIRVLMPPDGTFCRLTKDKTYIDYSIDSITCFVNDSPYKLLDDQPFYANGMLYIPLEPTLDAFMIEYSIQENILTIGG